jgi:O-antigen/teichoic acid export membrane protein
MGEKKSETSGQFGIYAFGKDILIYSLGNGLLLLFGFIQIFIIPKYLTVEDYGYWQLFMLYTIYVYILHFGFNDGILLRWAGKELSQVGDEIKIAFRALILEQVAVIVPLALLLYFLIRPPLQWMGLMILACAFVINLADFFINTARAFKRFRLLTAANVGRGLAFLLLVVALFVTGYLNYHNVVLAFLASYLIFLFTFAYWFRKYLRGEKPSISSLWAYGKENINIGIFVLFGNFIGGVLFLTTDRLMVSSFFPIDQFAIYALASTMIAMVYTFVKASSDVVFPYISAVAPQLRSRAYHLGKSAIILLWAAILVIYFPIVWLIESYLPQYVASLPVMKILLCTVGFGSLIQILHVNYYKAYRKQRQYFLWGITALAFLVMLNLLAIKIWGTLQSVAIATLISFSVWYIINELSLTSVLEQRSKEPWKSIVILVCYIGAFWLASFLADSLITQMLIYVGFFLSVTWLLLRRGVKELVAVASEVRSQRR